ncbi:MULTISPECIES: MarR family transcriptional regulator [unclassified Blastomonas]|jgi:MarR family transcriptional regulator, transcriptional regulator for hemolysin|uniref:MarR family winged helix-turn-helix transcriptional regulator n=1 Tax=unclassified Blastomonas TaxID=2626550 RepID=UPI0008248C20|nr:MULTISPECIES: MarR family transcriptional regulator [unclassified Blastomonas]
MDEVSDLISRAQMRREVITDDDELIYLMDEISRGARRMYDARVARIGLNQTQWRIIGQLLRDPSLTQTEIAKKLELEAATIGHAVADLCAKGLMERVRTEKDRRAWDLILTEEIDDLLPALRGSADRLHDLLWRGVTADEKRALQQILARISVNLEQHRTNTE